MFQSIWCSTPSTHVGSICRRRSSSATIKMSEMSKWLLLSCVTNGKFMNIVCVLVRRNRECLGKLLLSARVQKLYSVLLTWSLIAPHIVRKRTSQIHAIQIAFTFSCRKANGFPNRESWIMNWQHTAPYIKTEFFFVLHFSLRIQAFLGSLLWCNANILLARCIYFFVSFLSRGQM